MMMFHALTRKPLASASSSTHHHAQRIRHLAHHIPTTTTKSTTTTIINKNKRLDSFDLKRQRRHNSNYTIKIPSSTQSSSWERGAKLVKNVDRTNQYLEHIRDVHDPSQHLKTIEDELRGTMGKALGKQGQKILGALKKVHVERERYEHFIYSIVDGHDGDGGDVESMMKKKKNGETHGETTSTINGESKRNHDNNDIKETDDEQNHHKSSGHQNQKSSSNYTSTNHTSTNTNDSQEQNRLSSALQKLSFQSMSSSNQTKLLQIIHKYNIHKKDAEQARWELTVHRQAVGFIVNNHRFVQEKFPIPSQLPLPYDMDVNSTMILSNDGDQLDGCKNRMNKGGGGDGGVIRNFGDQLDWWEKIGRWR